MQNNEDGQVYAGFFVRLAAYLLDWLIVGTVLLMVKFPMLIASWTVPNNFLVRDFIFEYSLKDIILYLLGVSYFIILTYFTGATLGKRAMRLRVISSEESKLTFFQVAYRETVGRFLSELIMCVGYFMIGPDSQKRGLHDQLADTRVVYYHVKEVFVPAEIRYRQRSPMYVDPPANGQNTMSSAQPAFTQSEMAAPVPPARQMAQPGMVETAPQGVIQPDMPVPTNPQESLQPDMSVPNPQESVQTDILEPNPQESPQPSSMADLSSVSAEQPSSIPPEPTQDDSYFSNENF